MKQAPTWFVTTDVFLTYLTQPDSPRADDILHLFEAAEHDKVQLKTSEAVLGELLDALQSPDAGGKSRDEAATIVTSILGLEGLRVGGRKRVAEALVLYGQTPLSFADCIAAARSRKRGIEGVSSYNRVFDEVPGITRREPGSTV